VRKPKVRKTSRGTIKGIPSYKSKFRKSKKRAKGTGGPGHAHRKLPLTVSLYWGWKNNCPAGWRAALYAKFKPTDIISIQDYIEWITGGELLLKDALLFCRWTTQVVAGDRVPVSLETNKPETLKRFKTWLQKRIPRDT